MHGGCVCEGHCLCEGTVCVLGTVPRGGWLWVLQVHDQWVLGSAGKGAPVPVITSGLGTECSCCPQGPVPAELLTWGKRLGDPSPLPALLPTSKAVGRSPLGPAQIDKDFSLSWRWWPAPLAVR